MDIMDIKSDPATVVRNERRIDFNFTSDMRSVEKAVSDGESFIKAINGNFKRESLLRFDLVLRELLVNAVAHGNHHDPGANVSCSVEIDGNHAARITVEDEGQGFDYASLGAEITDDPRQEVRRGWPLIQLNSSGYEFNEKGNRVSVVVRLETESAIESAQSDDWAVVRPVGKLTAGIADELRLLFGNLIQKGFVKFRLDFVMLELIDSVSLSVLIGFARTLSRHEAGAVAEVVNANTDIRGLFHTTKLDNLFIVK